MTADVLTRQTVDDLIIDDDFFNSDTDQLGDDFVQKSARQSAAISRDDKPTLSPRRTLKRKAPGDALDRELDNNDDRAYDSVNIDQEIKVKKQRAPIPKLDTERLLSEKGIPKIRALTRNGSIDFKRKLRLKGKGHEFTDCARLLNFYQLWLDNLYPRAKFADALQLVEKAGHSKHMQMYRKSWIDEGKPGYKQRDSKEQEQEGLAEEAKASFEDSTDRLQDISTHWDINEESMFIDEQEQQGQEIIDSAPDEDELTALIAQNEAGYTNTPNRSTKPRNTSLPVDISDDEDELEAFLAEETARQKRLNREDEYQRRNIESGRGDVATGQPDELDELLELDDEAAPATAVRRRNDGPGTDAIDHGEQVTDRDRQDQSNEDLDVRFDPSKIQNEMELPQPAGASPPGLSPTKITKLSSLDEYAVSSSPLPNIHTDDLDQLMDEHEYTIHSGNSHRT